MKRIFTAAIAVAAVAFAGAIPAKATTFPSLTTIYVASGAFNAVPTPASGTKTLINCTNMSGVTASVRYQFRQRDGTPLAGGTLALASLAAHTVTTAGEIGITGEVALPTGAFFGGTIQVLSTQSAVYCTAMMIQANSFNTGNSTNGVDLHMVRFNPHPGTVE